jgi:hypothetical protein
MQSVESKKELNYEVLSGHDCFENAVSVYDYPYGRLRTEMRFWIESKPKHGYRLVTRSLNPKNGRWNNPKKTTYSAFLSLVKMKENGHIKTIGFSNYTEESKIQDFLNIHREYFSQDQINLIEAIIKIKTKVSDHYKKAIQELEEKPRIKNDTLEENTLYKKSTITDLENDEKLIRLSLNGYAVKKRCRKEDYHSITIGYLKRPESLDDSSAMLTFLKYKDEIKKALQDNFRSFERLCVSLKPVTFNARKGNSMFYGFQESLSIGSRNRDEKRVNVNNLINE